MIWGPDKGGVDSLDGLSRRGTLRTFATGLEGPTAIDQFASPATATSSGSGDVNNRLDTAARHVDSRPYTNAANVLKSVRDRLDKPVREDYETTPAHVYSKNTLVEMVTYQIERFESLPNGTKPDGSDNGGGGRNRDNGRGRDGGNSN